MKSVFIFIILMSPIFINCELVEEKEIEYKVACSSGTVDITLSNKNEDTEQYSNVFTPWTYIYSIKLTQEEYQFVYISAQNNQDNGTVTSEIFVNGKKYKSSISTGAYVIATASGTVEY